MIWDCFYLDTINMIIFKPSVRWNLYSSISYYKLKIPLIRSTWKLSHAGVLQCRRFSHYVGLVYEWDLFFIIVICWVSNFLDLCLFLWLHVSQYILYLSVHPVFIRNYRCFIILFVGFLLKRMSKYNSSISWSSFVLDLQSNVSASQGCHFLFIQFVRFFLLFLRKVKNFGSHYSNIFEVAIPCLVS